MGMDLKLGSERVRRRRGRRSEEVVDLVRGRVVVRRRVAKALASTTAVGTDASS
jgi:hypothetical protein